VDSISISSSISLYDHGEVEDELGLLGVMPGLAGEAGIVLVPLPVVLEDVPVPVPGALDGDGALLLVDGARGGGLDEPEPEPESLSHATSARVARVAPTAMIVLFMVKSPNSDAQERV
jgi:hypothetical protein